ncbi:PREDICTED: cytochrome c oxidase subunit 5B, mitochondrial [Lepidothrix coronata]|uniref:Cytochrome c oxidase subunit 5B, mitochondrial n=1 Tax=Lepidothrix coronata TaxID=321398 RepID=A0A6J0J174_9PASS|nr:PREDICTED: cytochrome c oxidase subunit 5B, mitochondrial [Lepidothrix coronata]
MASRLLRVSAALRLLPGASARAAPARQLGVPGSLASDEEQATGMERKVMEALNKGLVSAGAPGGVSDPAVCVSLWSVCPSCPCVHMSILVPMSTCLSCLCPCPVPTFLSLFPGPIPVPVSMPCPTLSLSPGEEDNSCVVWFWLHQGEAQRCPSCGAHYKLIPHELPH